MVYESGFSTRRTYSSRPVVTSYAVSVYKTSYPVYSSYSFPPRVYIGARIATSPVRVVTSPVRTSSRITYSPERLSSWYYSSPSFYSCSYLPETFHNLHKTYTTTYTPKYYYTPIARIFRRPLNQPFRISTSSIYSIPFYPKRSLPRYAIDRQCNYHNIEPFEIFKDETDRIRFKAQSLIRDIHTPVMRRARSCTPFPVTGCAYRSSSQIPLDAYVERITNQGRHRNKEDNGIFNYPQSDRKYIGKSHLSSVRICGDKAYNIRRPLYDSDKVRTDINILSWYLNQQGKNKKTKNDKPVLGEENTPQPKPNPTEILENQPNQLN